MNRAEFVRMYANGTVLDAGAGDCSFVWGGRAPDGVTTLDIDMRKGLHVLGEVHGLPFTDGAFGTVMLIDVLEHVDDVSGAVAEALRVCSDRILISYPEEDSTACAQRRNYTEYMRIAMDHSSVCDTCGQDDHGHLKSHWHWKSGAEICRDINIIASFKPQICTLDYGLYAGYGAIILKAMNL